MFKLDKLKPIGIGLVFIQCLAFGQLSSETEPALRSCVSIFTQPKSDHVSGPLVDQEKPDMYHPVESDLDQPIDPIDRSLDLLRMRPPANEDAIRYGLNFMLVDRLFLAKVRRQMFSYSIYDQVYRNLKSGYWSRETLIDILTKDSRYLNGSPEILFAIIETTPNHDQTDGLFHRILTSYYQGKGLKQRFMNRSLTKLYKATSELMKSPTENHLLKVRSELRNLYWSEFDPGERVVRLVQKTFASFFMPQKHWEHLLDEHLLDVLIEKNLHDTLGEVGISVTDTKLASTGRWLGTYVVPLLLPITLPLNVATTIYTGSPIIESYGAPIKSLKLTVDDYMTLATEPYQRAVQIIYRRHPRIVWTQDAFLRLRDAGRLVGLLALIQFAGDPKAQMQTVTSIELFANTAANTVGHAFESPQAAEANLVVRDHSLKPLDIMQSQKAIGDGEELSIEDRTGSLEIGLKSSGTSSSLSLKVFDPKKNLVNAQVIELHASDIVSEREKTTEHQLDSINKSLQDLAVKNPNVGSRPLDPKLRLGLTLTAVGSGFNVQDVVSWAKSQTSLGHVLLSILMHVHGTLPR